MAAQARDHIQRPRSVWSSWNADMPHTFNPSGWNTDKLLAHTGTFVEGRGHVWKVVNWGANKVMNQRKTWQNESEIGYTQLSREAHERKQFKRSPGTERESVGSQCSECSAVELSSFLSSCSSVQAPRSSWNQRIKRNQKIRTNCQSSVWGQAEQFSEKLREARLNQSAWRGVWARTAELNQLELRKN